MEQMEELISIIIPVYNSEKYLRKCLNTVVQQTYHNIEIILINDGTKDRSMEIINSFAAYDNRFKIINQQNKGAAAARNRGIETANGQYIFFLDSDDGIHPKTIEILYKLILENKAEIVSCDFVKTSDIPQEFPEIEVRFEVCNNITALYNLFIGSISGAKGRLICSKLYKRKLFDKISFPERKFHEDEFIIHELIDNINSICYCLVPLYYYTQNPMSSMHNLTVKRSLDAIEASENRINYFYKTDKDEILCLMAVKQCLEEIINNYYALYNDKLLDKETKEILMDKFGRLIDNIKGKNDLKYKIFRKNQKLYRFIVRLPQKIFYTMKHNKQEGIK